MTSDADTDSELEAMAAAIRYIEREARSNGYELTARLLGAAVQAAKSEKTMSTDNRDAIVVSLADYAPPKN
jgi:hypothetical protein